MEEQEAALKDREVRFFCQILSHHSVGHAQCCWDNSARVF